MSSTKKSNLNSFEQIKVHYWYSEVKVALVEHMLVRIVEVPYKKRRNILAIIEKIDVSDNSPISIEKKIDDIKSLIDEINRLGKDNHKKRWGPNDAQIHDYLKQLILDDDLNDLLPSKNDGHSPLPSEKTWSRYRLAKNKPDNYLDKVDSILEGTKRAYSFGPCSLFKILEAENVTEALDLFKLQFIKLVTTQLKVVRQAKKESINLGYDLEKAAEVFSNMHEHFGRLEIPYLNNEANRYDHYCKSFFALKRLASPYGANSDFILKGQEMNKNILAQSESFFGFIGEDASCLWLALAFISAKYFADYDNLRTTYKLCDVLKAIEFYHSIPANLWFEENRDPESSVILEFIEAQTR